MSKFDYLENKFLEHITGTAYTAPTMWVGLSSTIPNENGTNITEPSGGGYARVTTAAKWGSVTSGSVSNNADITFPESTGTWGSEITHFILFDASTAGNALRFEWLGRTSGSDKFFNPSDVNTTTNRITLTSHGYVNNDQVVFGVNSGSTLSSGLTANTRYHVKVIDANTIELYSDVALTTIIDITSTGSGTQFLFKIQPRTVNASGITLRFATGSLILTEN